MDSFRKSDRMCNKKTMPASPDAPKTQNAAPKSTTLQPTPRSSDPALSAEGQKHLAIMHETINEMLADIQQCKTERKRSRLSKKKKKEQNPVGKVLAMQENENNELFNQLHEMVIWDQYVANPGNKGDDSKNPKIHSKSSQRHESKAKGKCKGKLEVKIDKRENREGEKVDTALRSPQEFYPYCI
ncbi:hypothetical protein BGX38DRAFT_36458 [Terfezia claveryi]|nr:hypothetical protein BGX38DRAFT_36458 [Terfezia claveryi]